LHSLVVNVAASVLARHLCVNGSRQSMTLAAAHNGPPPSDLRFGRSTEFQRFGGEACVDVIRKVPG